jgi:hypothetical protein
MPVIKLLHVFSSLSIEPRKYNIKNQTIIKLIALSMLTLLAICSIVNHHPLSAMSYPNPNPSKKPYPTEPFLKEG